MQNYQTQIAEGNDESASITAAVPLDRIEGKGFAFRCHQCEANSIPDPGAFQAIRSASSAGWRILQAQMQNVLLCPACLLGNQLELERNGRSYAIVYFPEPALPVQTQVRAA